MNDNTIILLICISVISVISALGALYAHFFMEDEDNEKDKTED